MQRKLKKLQKLNVEIIENGFLVVISNAHRTEGKWVCNSPEELGRLVTALTLPGDRTPEDINAFMKGEVTLWIDRGEKPLNLSFRDAVDEGVQKIIDEEVERANREAERGARERASS